MKQVILILFVGCMILICYKSHSQAFIRVYNNHGKKIGKGKVLNMSDTSLEIMRNNNTDTILITKIGYIKIKRGLGADIAGGFGAGTILSVLITSDLIKDVEYIGARGWRIIGTGVLSGIAAGTIAGAVSGIVAKRQKFFINGDPEKWKIIKEKILTLKPDDYPF